jgi:DNA helicase-2/ATP-dependent DNA helicase PcrA
MPAPDLNKDDVAKLYPGPILVLSSPGTGKTHALARRVKYLVEDRKVNPDEITVITFTNEASTNMRNRLNDREKNDVYLSPENQPKFICTMHSLGQRIISENLSKANLKEDFRVSSSISFNRVLMGDSAQIIDLERSLAPRTEKCRQQGKCELQNQEDKCKICRKYRELLNANNALDYDDQIMIACKILKENQGIIDAYKVKARYLLVDEYQDINHSQFELIKLLAGGQESGLFCVGDDDQSIYSFRGGSPFYIMNFGDHFPNAKVKQLSVCWRCCSEIFTGAFRMIEQLNSDRKPKSIPEFKNEGGSILFFNVPSQEREAHEIAKIIRVASPSKEVLILIPHQGFAEPIKKKLRKWRINFQSKFDTDESGINVLDTLRNWVENKKDNFALRQCMQSIIDSGNFEIPSSRVKKIEKKQRREVILKDVSKCWNRVINDHISYYDSVKEAAKINEVIEQIVEALDSIDNLTDVNIGDFMKSVGDLLRPWPSPHMFLAETSKILAEIKSQDIGGSGMVRILTMQRAKGLEADVVIIVGLDKAMFPRDGLSEIGKQEAARLFYVSMTRAKAELYLFHARKREASISYIVPPPGESYSLLYPSPFIDFIPKSNIEKKFLS